MRGCLLTFEHHDGHVESYEVRDLERAGSILRFAQDCPSFEFALDDSIESGDSGTVNFATIARVIVTPRPGA